MKRFTSIIFFVCFSCALAFAGGGQAAQGAASPGGLSGDKQPFGKYNPPITVYSTKGLSANFPFEEGDTVDKNPWLQYNRDELGIDVKWKWVDYGTDEGQRTKMATAIASNDLPDIFGVDQQQFYMLAQAGLIWDITDIYETYASPVLREFMDSAPLQASAVKIDNRMYALPLFGSDTYANVLWARQDWIEKLNLPNPDSVQNVIKIAEAFAKNDPDGNGRDDTIGLLASSNLFGGYGNLVDFFHGYHAYIGGRWLKDNAGNLVNGVIQPEVKTALTALADMYRRGIVDREFVTRDDNKNMEAVTSGKAGLLYSSPYLPLAAPNIEQMNPGSKLVAYPIPSADSRPVNFIIGNPVSTYYVVNKKFAHPEALLKLGNLSVKVAAGPPDAYNPGSSVPHGYEYFHLNIFWIDIPNVNSFRYRHINEAFERGNTSTLTAWEAEFHRQMTLVYSGKAYEPTDWAGERVFAKEGSSFAVVVNHYEKNKQTSLDPYLGPPTDTMAIRQASLDALRDEVFTKIIVGESPISAFDTFVQDWKRQGGDKITEEVNAWYKANR